MLRRTASYFHYYLKLNITHTSDIVVKRPRKASAGIQSHGILPLLSKKKKKNRSCLQLMYRTMPNAWYKVAKVLFPFQPLSQKNELKDMVNQLRFRIRMNLKIWLINYGF